MHSNHLIHEKSPYLLQHAHNPINWFPWSHEAFEKAKVEDKMVLVSIGYATCHWCHVMERETFEDAHLADYFNQYFIGIKVDREERPDIDKIYMDALHAQQQQGGWPLNFFVTSEGKPFFGGTYFPPEPRYGRRSFRQVLEMLLTAWQSDRSQIIEMADSLTIHLRHQNDAYSSSSPSSTAIAREIEEQTVHQWKTFFDPVDGGFTFQNQNKFPPSMGLMHLLRVFQVSEDPSLLHMVELTLKKMKEGGIYDQLAGGLSRYSTDFQWLVPHFEKMLYDNALFVWALIEASQVTKKPFYQEATRDVLNYVQTTLLSPEGGFYSAEDADSEGEEGKFYVWDADEFQEVLGQPLARIAAAYWGVTPEGNFEHGTTILAVTRDLSSWAEQEQTTPQLLQKQLEHARQLLLSARQRRMRPLCDDKVLTSWNALMISAFARAAKVFEDESYANIAIHAAHFIRKRLLDPLTGRLLRRYRDQESKIPAYLSDYANSIIGFLDLYEYSYDPQWLKLAQGFANEIQRLFANENGPYFETGSDVPSLLVRPIEMHDGVEPSGNSTVVLAFFRLDAYGFDSYYADALKILKYSLPLLKQSGVHLSAMHWAHQWFLNRPAQVVIIGKNEDPMTQKMLSWLRKAYLPHTVVVWAEPDQVLSYSYLIPLLQQRIALQGKTTAYVCYRQECTLPVHTLDALIERLQIQN